MKFSRKEIWQHNGFLGTVSFARKGLLRIINSKTVTAESKALAVQLEHGLDLLYGTLKERAK